MRNCCLDQQGSLSQAEDPWDETSGETVSKCSCALVPHDYQTRPEVAVCQLSWISIRAYLGTTQEGNLPYKLTWTYCRITGNSLAT